MEAMGLSRPHAVSEGPVADLIGEAAAGIEKDEARDRQSRRRGTERQIRRHRNQWVLATVLLAACVLLTAHTISHLGAPVSSRAPIADPQTWLQVGLGVAMDEVEAAREATGEYPRQLEFLVGMEEDGWSYTRVGPTRYLLSWSVDGWIVTYDSETEATVTRAVREPS